MTAQARLLGGRYQVGELLGYGGMAEVHRGRDLRLGRDVAIKMLRTDLARDATFQERFRREAQNSAALNHPAIVAVYDTGEEISSTGEKLPFIVMEFVSGHTLKEVLAQEQRIQPRRALEMIADICAALEFSHRHGIIHRDIKPGNVMITQNGQVKVMDFGIARALASGATTMTQTSAVIGTAQYLSPEQARGESVDARSDVYAAGCVLFELLVGHPPFVGDSPVSVAYQHVREDPRAPSDINPEVSPAVDSIVLKALAKNPMNRYQSAQEMRADALRAVAGRPVMATPVMTEAETMAMQGGPQREWQPQAATTMQRTIPGGPPPRAPERRSWMMASLAALGVLVVVVLTVALVMSRNNENKGNNNAGDQPTVVTHEMPDLKNMTEEQARRALQAANLQKIDAGTPTTGEDCDGRVVDQDPAAKTQVPETDTVSYTLCLKPEEVPVPTDLKGATKAQAESRLEGIGLKVEFKSVKSSQPLDTVVGVEKAGEEVPPGTTITVQLSNARVVQMPDVVGENGDVAKALLEQFGQFNVTTNQVVDPTKEPGTVATQQPKAKANVEKGSDVVITIVVEDPDPGTSEPTPNPSEDDGSGGGNVVGNSLTNVIRRED
jgi:serine/threonine protein kinase/beta-lactam-binding protein with PASTA domain